MGNKQQLSGKDQVLNPENFIRHLGINGDQSFDNKAESQNSTRINTTSHNETSSTYNSRSSKKVSSPKRKKPRQVTLSKIPSQRETQIYNAKKQYERKKVQNQNRLAEIRQKIQTYSKIYRDNDESQDKQINQNDQDEVIFWGKKISMKKDDPMEKYYEYRFPKQPVKLGQQNDEYSNWDIYKNQMSRKRFQQLQQEQQKLIDEEQEFKSYYQSLVRLKKELYVQEIYQQKNKQVFLAPKSLKPQQWDAFEQDHQKVITPSFKHAQKITYIQQTPLVKKRRKQPQTASTATSIFSDRNSYQIDNWTHPQNIINSDPQYYAKQMHYYDQYIMKKRSNYVPLSAIAFYQQYPSKRQKFIKHIRNEQTVIDPHLQYGKRKKSRKLKSKSKSKAKKSQNIINDSMYTKVYEKIPRKRNSYLHSPEQRFQAVKNLYPWQDTSAKQKSKIDNYPMQMQVNDSLRKQQSQNGSLYFHFISRQNSNEQEWDQFKKANKQIPQGEYDESNEKKIARNINRYQRELQSRILQKVRFKNL